MTQKYNLNTWIQRCLHIKLIYVLAIITYQQQALEKWEEEFKQKHNDNALPQNNYVEEWWNVILEESNLSENQISHPCFYIIK